MARVLAVATKAKKKTLRERCDDVDVWLKTECGQGGKRNAELDLIRSEYDLLRTFCPGYGQTMFKTIKKRGRKRRVSRVYTTSDVSVPRVDIREGDMIDAEEVRHKWFCGKTRYKWSQDKDGHLVWDEEVPVLERELKIPKCNKCLHGYDLKCKHLDRMLETIRRRCERKAQGSYEFRTMLRRVLGAKWFDENVTLKEV